MNDYLSRVDLELREGEVRNAGAGLLVLMLYLDLMLLAAVVYLYFR